MATPQVGEKEVTYRAVSEWIAEKLKQEFQVRFHISIWTFKFCLFILILNLFLKKVLVFPNMDDFYIPILKSEAWQ